MKGVFWKEIATTYHEESVGACARIDLEGLIEYIAGWERGY